MTAISVRRPRAARLADTAGLTWALSVKNFKIRYKRAALGVLWAVLQPAIQAAVLAFVVLRVLHVHPVAHYPVFVLSGLLPWAWFSSSMSMGTVSIVENASLLKKVAVDPLVYPLSAVGAAAIASAASLPVLLVAAFASGVVGPRLLLVVPAILLQLALIVATVAITSALYPAFRDVRFVVESLLVIGFYATPVLYRPHNASELIAHLLLINPMTGVLDLYHRAVVGTALDTTAVLVTLGEVAVLLVAGLAVFRRRAAEFVDLI